MGTKNKSNKNLLAELKKFLSPKFLISPASILIKKGGYMEIFPFKLDGLGLAMLGLAVIFLTLSIVL